MIGIVIGSTFNIFDKIFGHLGLVYQFNPLLISVAPSILVFFGALLAIRAQR